MYCKLAFSVPCPTEDFCPTQVVHQGDSLSPYLFILCLEYLSVVITEACSGKQWTPLRISRAGPRLSQLFFADDIVLFGNARVENCSTIADILEKFCLETGQKISLQKSKIDFTLDTDPSIHTQIANLLNILVTENLGSLQYLGCPWPIHHTRPKKETFQNLIDKVNRKLDDWKRNCLNVACRCTPIKSVNSTITSSLFQTNALPKSITNSLDRINRNFFVGLQRAKKKLHFVGWDKVTEDKCLGGSWYQAYQGC